MADPGARQAHLSCQDVLRHLRLFLSGERADADVLEADGMCRMVGPRRRGVGKAAGARLWSGRAKI